MGAPLPERGILACVAALQTETRCLPLRLTFSPGDLPIAETASAQGTAERERFGAPWTAPRREPGLLPSRAEVSFRRATPQARQ